VSWRPRARPPGRERDPARVGGGIGRVLREIGLDLERSRRLEEAFAAALGPELAPHFEIAGLRGRTLEVRSREPAFSQELAIHRAEVLAALAERLGDEAPTELRLHVR
jgi:hypothetical protein